jgi:hypothetical protein
MIRWGPLIDSLDSVRTGWKNARRFKLIVHHVLHLVGYPAVHRLGISSRREFVSLAIAPIFVSNKPTLQYATSFLQSIYYGLTIRAGQPRPPPQSPRYQNHRRRIYIVVIVGYLLYTLLETFRQVQRDGDFYEVLEVSPFAEERAIKSRFRKLAAQHHPDKTGFDNDSDAYFIFLRGAQETLVDPVKRFAYDRFGPDMQSWGPQKTMRDYIMTSITRSIFPQYFGGLLLMMVLNWLWWPNLGRYVSLSFLDQHAMA